VIVHTKFGELWTRFDVSIIEILEELGLKKRFW